MNVTEAVASRRSVRQFLDKPVDGALVRQILETAKRAPSGGNLQPWRVWVLGGEAVRLVLTNPARLRLFNWTMAGLLVLSLYPVLNL